MTGSKTVAAPVAAMNSAVAAFADLHTKFMRGRQWIITGYASRGWNTGARTYDPRFETDIKVFTDNVEAPMDSAWNILTQKERKEAEIECDRRGYRIKP